MRIVVPALLAAAIAVSHAPARAAETVVTGIIGSPTSGSWPYMIGVKKGFFADAGIAPDIVYAPTAPGLMQQLAAGSLDVIAMDGVVEPIHAIAKGAPVAILRLVGAVPPYEIVAKPGIAGIKDLKGKIVCIGGLVDINRVYLERVMQGNGLHDGDFDLVIIGNTAARFAALKSGAVDATMLVPPFNFLAEAAGFANIGMVIDYARDLPFTAADVSLPWAAKHRDTAVRFRAVIDRSIAWFDDDGNRDEAIDILAEAAHSDRAEVAKSYDFLRKIGYFTPSDAISRSGLQSLIDAMKALNDVDDTITVDRLVMPGLTRVID